jgi:hypothetical protein
LRKGRKGFFFLLRSMGKYSITAEKRFLSIRAIINQINWT